MKDELTMARAEADKLRESMKVTWLKGWEIEKLVTMEARLKTLEENGIQQH